MNSIEKLSKAIEETERDYPLPRCRHGKALRDGAGDRLEPTCGCRMSSTREVASQLVEEWVANGYCQPNHLHPLIDKIDAALRQREQEVRAEERERAAGIAETRAEVYRDKAKAQAHKGNDSLSLHFLSECNGVLEVAAIIRRDDTPQEGE